MTYTPELVFSAVLLVLFVLLLVFKRLPSLDSTLKLVEVLNTRAGNIAVLLALSIWFFVVGVRFIYFLMALIDAGKLTSDNSLAMIGLNFVTGVAFGSAFGALLKSMNGGDVPAPPSSPGPEPPK